MSEKKYTYAEVQLVADKLFVNLSEHDKPKLHPLTTPDYEAEKILYAEHQKQINEWKQSVDTFQVNPDDGEEEFKKLIKQIIADNKKIAVMFITEYSQAYMKGLQKGIQIPVNMVDIQDCCVHGNEWSESLEKSCGCNMTYEKTKFAVVQKPNEFSGEEKFCQDKANELTKLFAYHFLISTIFSKTNGNSNIDVKLFVKNTVLLHLDMVLKISKDKNYQKTWNRVKELIEQDKTGYK